MKIAFVGPPAVGKDAVSDFISHKYSIPHISSGDLVRNYVKEHNMGEIDRTNLSIVARDLRAKFGGDILVKIAVEQSPDNLILSGLRTVDEVKTFKDFGGKVISITAPLERRFELAKIRRRIDDNVSFENFKAIEERENANPDKNSQNVRDVLAMADIEIVNDGSLEDLYNRTIKVVDDLK